MTRAIGIGRGRCPPRTQNPPGRTQYPATQRCCSGPLAWLLNHTMKGSSVSTASGPEHDERVLAWYTVAPSRQLAPQFSDFLIDLFRHIGHCLLCHHCLHDQRSVLPLISAVPLSVYRKCKSIDETVRKPSVPTCTIYGFIEPVKLGLCFESPPPN